ncbi:MAG: response regulator [Paracoccaceae bacterium]|jgi:two-component system chemotaxis response regulator CheY
MTLRVLAVDDSLTIREMLKSCLVSAGCEVELAEDGVDGLDRLAAVRPDVIITDINMPRMDGFGLIEAVRGGDSHKSVPILVLTTESADELKQRAREAGATGWIVKPFDDERLISAIRRVAAYQA